MEGADGIVLMVGKGEEEEEESLLAMIVVGLLVMTNVEDNIISIIKGTINIRPNLPDIFPIVMC